MKTFGKILLYFFSGLFFFFFFLYLTFPYQILKEKIVSSISKETKTLVSIESLGPKLPLGLTMDKLRFYKPGSGDLQIQKLDVRLGFFSLLFGGLNFSVRVEDHNKEGVELNSFFPLKDIFSTESQAIPSYISLTSDKFDIAPFVNYYLSSKASDENLNPVFKSALKDTLFIGKLKSNVRFDFDGKDILLSTGSLDIEFVQAGLNILSLPFQNFKQARIKTSLSKGLFEFSPETKIISDDLNIDISGSVKQAEKLTMSKLDVSVKIKMMDELKESFGMLLDLATGKPSEGEARVKIKGTLVRPKVDAF